MKNGAIRVINSEYLRNLLKTNELKGLHSISTDDIFFFFFFFFLFFQKIGFDKGFVVKVKLYLCSSQILLLSVSFCNDL